MTPAKWCIRHSACSEAVEWIEQFDSLADAWDVCERSDWMLWALGKIKHNNEEELLKLIRLCACRFVREIWHLLTDDRSKKAVEVAEKYAVGEAAKKELDAAWSAAESAWSAPSAPSAQSAWSAAWSAAESAWSAPSAQSAARSAARSAASAQSAAESARSVAWSAAESAARSAAWSAARSAAESAARSAARNKQANIIREIVGNPFRKEMP